MYLSVWYIDQEEAIRLCLDTSIFHNLGSEVLCVHGEHIHKSMWIHKNVAHAGYSFERHLLNGQVVLKILMMVSDTIITASRM